MKLLENIPLAPLTTLGVGGPARFFVDAADTADIREALDFARLRELPLFVLGGGSNLVVADTGFNGVVVRNSLRGIERNDDAEFAEYRVSAGESWDEFVARAVSEGCAGVECLSGIPGTVGGTPVQNVGAYGQEVSHTIITVEAMDRSTDEAICFSKAECDFSYRTSRFNTADLNRYVIVRVTFKLRRGGRPTIRYADLHNRFSQRETVPTLAEVRDVVLEIRRSKSMVIDPADENHRSAGSFFKNPVIADVLFQELAERMQSRGLTIPSYPAGEGMRKLSAAWLVEHAGVPRGYTRGAAGISTRHSLAIVNRGGATAAEIVGLKNEIQERVRSEFGIALYPEPVFLGF